MFKRVKDPLITKSKSPLLKLLYLIKYIMNLEINKYSKSLILLTSKRQKITDKSLFLKKVILI